MPTRISPVRPVGRSVRRGIEFEVIQRDPQASFYVAETRVKLLPYFWHYHPEMELALILKGRGTRIVGDSVEHFEAGDLCVLGPNLPHCWISDPNQETGSHAIAIQFLPDFLGEKAFASPELHAIRQLLIRARRGLRFDGPSRAVLREKMIEIARLPSGHWQRVPQLLWLLGLLAENSHAAPLATDRPEPAADQNDRRRISRVMALTNVAPDEFPSQKVVDDAMRLSPAAFSRFFRQHMGKTYVDYIIDLRLAHVCRGLMESDASIIEAAFAAGFSTLSNFNRQFRRRKGCTPRQWRERTLRQHLNST